jgi:ABC-type cobalt transport system substrate-binding protein
LPDKHGTYRALILFSNNKEAAGAFLSLVPIERQNKTYKGTANQSGEVEILKVKPGNYDVHVNAMKNPDTGEKESHKGLGLGVKGGDKLLQRITLN